MQAIKAVGILSKPGLEHGYGLVPALLEWLGARGIESRFDAETGKSLKGPAIKPLQEFECQFDDENGQWVELIAIP